MKNLFRGIRKQLVLGLLAKKVRISNQFLEKYVEQAILNDLFHELDIDCVIDVGANVGQFASDLRMIGFKKQIISFEPVASAFELLSAKMGNDPNWKGYPFALGDKKGKATINVGDDTALSSILPFQSDIQSSGSQEISIERLDEFWNELDFKVENPRVFLKMDTQGFDAAVFEGAIGCLGSILGMLSEISVIPLYEGILGYKSSLDLYESAGFKLCNLSSVSRNSRKEIVELNCILRR